MGCVAPDSRGTTLTLCEQIFHTRPLMNPRSVLCLLFLRFFDRKLCSNHLGAVRLDKAILLRYSGVLRKGTSRQLHSLQKSSPQPLTNFTAQRSVQRPNGCSPTAPNEPQRLANLRAFFTRWARRRECVARLDNTLWRWAKLPPLFPRQRHSTICPVTDHNFDLRPLAVIHASPNDERAT